MERRRRRFWHATLILRERQTSTSSSTEGGFRHVFNCCWQESVKPLQFYCHTLPLSYQLHERQLLFYRRLLISDNIVLRTLAGLPRVRFEMLGIAAKYDDELHYSIETVKNAVWLSFVNNIRF